MTLSQVTEPEFEEYLASYPRWLLHNVVTGGDPPVDLFCDETIRSSIDNPEAVARIMRPYSHDDEASYWVMYPMP